MRLTGASVVAATVKFFFGLSLATTEIYTLTVNGVPCVSTNPLSTATYLHIVAEKDDAGQWQAYVFSDCGIKSKINIGIVEWTSQILSTGNWRLPADLSLIVVADDTPTGTMLSAVEIEEAVLSASNSGSWEYSDQGYVEDTDKEDFSVLDPHLSSPSDEGEIEFTTADEYDYTQWTVAGRGNSATENNLLQLNDTSFRTVDSVKARGVSGESLVLSVRSNEGRVIAQPDFSRLRPSAVQSASLIIDDYAETGSYGYGTLQNAVLKYEPTAVNPSGILLLQASTAGQGLVFVPPSDFGLLPFCIEIWTSATFASTITAVAPMFVSNSSTDANQILSLVRSSSSATVFGIRIFGKITTATSLSFSTNAERKITICFQPTTGKTGLVWGYLNGSKILEPTLITLTNVLLNFGGGASPSTTSFVGPFRITHGSARYSQDDATIPFDNTQPFPLP